MYKTRVNQVQTEFFIRYITVVYPIQQREKKRVSNIARLNIQKNIKFTSFNAYYSARRVGGPLTSMTGMDYIVSRQIIIRLVFFHHKQLPRHVSFDKFFFLSQKYRYNREMNFSLTHLFFSLPSNLISIQYCLDHRICSLIQFWVHLNAQSTRVLFNLLW